MKVSSTILSSALCLVFTSARQTPPLDYQKLILPCSEQGCDFCSTVEYGVREGYPNCNSYDALEAFGYGDAASGDFHAASGQGYDVWWDSADPGDSCQYVVRSPADADSSDCGLFLTSWDTEGCFYTRIAESFNLQFCCGTGDCGAAAPVMSIREAREQAAVGNTTVVNLGFDLGSMALKGRDSGKRAIEDLGEIRWERSSDQPAERSHPRELTARQEDAKPLPDGNCRFLPDTDSHYTQAGRTVAASSEAGCDTTSCAVMASAAVSEGFSVSPSVSLNVANVLTSAVNEQFTYMNTYTASYTYMQTGGTTGYVSFTPTSDCYTGYFTDCQVNDGQNIRKIDPSVNHVACTPKLSREGDQTVPFGQFLFVYTN